MIHYEIRKIPAGIGREHYVVTADGVRIGNADDEYQAEVIAMTHEIRGYYYA